ncbi:aspartate/glutamate racemase family protein [Angelakisella massiliensis]|uniref:aspartate/glutamate racemase family protein n=1 Tax=Angelakisella massiliensis TaxID=1871018 RepID=UPI0008F8E7DF|nr:aspartate/glutamate racemase family protein [Angelakisella massiliensis]
MKTIGLIGGMSWESTVTYYKVINETVKEKLGGLHSAKCLLYSVDFEEIEACQAQGQWEESGIILTQAAQALERAGADFLVICTNTMHKVAPQIQRDVSIPLLHIAKATARQLHRQGITRVGLLGTRYTMEQDFYKEVLRQEGIQVLIPGEKDRNLVNDVIYHQLCLGIISPQSRKEYLRIIGELAEQGAQGVILGCTEIGLLVSQENTSVPLFDTTLIHGRQAALFAMGMEE